MLGRVCSVWLWPILFLFSTVCTYHYVKLIDVHIFSSSHYCRYLKSIANSLEEKLRWGTLLNTKAHDIERDVRVKQYRSDGCIKVKYKYKKKLNIYVYCSFWQIVQARQSISQVQPQISLYTQETRQLQADVCIHFQIMFSSFLSVFPFFFRRSLN